jgi:HSP20 family protein
VPAFEVKETNDAFTLRADVPGVEEKDLDIGIHNGVLTVSGNRQSEERREGESYAVYERQYGSFSRSFSLPDMADAERIEAKLANGVLELKIPKKAEAKPRKISINH